MQKYFVEILKPRERWSGEVVQCRAAGAECELVGFIQFICILILKFKTRPNTSLCEIEQREETCSGPGVRLGKTLHRPEAENITKYQQICYEHLKEDINIHVYVCV